MHIIGLIGGVASGKSAVAAELAAMGAVVLDGDAAGHQVLREDVVKEAIRARWGDAVFSAEGEVDRATVAAIVFAPPPDGPRELEALEQITHPRIRELLSQEAARHEAAGAEAAVLDAAVMLKAGWHSFCDTVVYVDAPRDVRLDRAKTRGWTEPQFRQREASQETLAEKRRRADFVIDNGGDLAETRTQAQNLWKTLTNQ